MENIQNQEVELPFQAYDEERFTNYNCPVCYENFSFTLKPYIISCGHSLCYQCYQAINNTQNLVCPECRQPFQKNPSQNISLYRLLLQERVFCVKQQEGCEFNDKLDKLKDHIEKYCEYMNNQEKKNFLKSFRYTPCPPKKPIIQDRDLMSEYKGDINKDKLPDGFGELKFKNGSNYIGNFKDGEFDGHGVYTQVYDKNEDKKMNNAVYDGTWKNSRRYGKGRQQYPNNESYEGEWKQNLRNGVGIYTFANGGFYKGEWKMGKYDGEGIKMDSDGSYYNGQFKDGLEDGKGEKSYKSGVYKGYEYSGNWVKGVWHGDGQLIKNANEKQKGYFENGQLIHGEVTTFDVQKQKPITQFYQNGNLVKDQKNCIIF